MYAPKHTLVQCLGVYAILTLSVVQQWIQEKSLLFWEFFLTHRKYRQSIHKNLWFVTSQEGPSMGNYQENIMKLHIHRINQTILSLMYKEVANERLILSTRQVHRGALPCASDR